MTIYYLCVKTHQKTGLKYLCQTRKKDPYKYKGSGTDWVKHLKEHGVKHDTEILIECRTKEELKTYGLYYSNLWNVVDSPEWANLKPEDGGGGWYLFGDKNPQKKESVRKKTSIGMKKYLDENPEIKEYRKQWRNKFWTTEQRKKSNFGGLGSVSVVDLDGISKRIPKEEFESIDRSQSIENWLYVGTRSKEALRRKQQKPSLRTAKYEAF
jgi:hypothetical protein